MGSALMGVAGGHGAVRFLPSRGDDAGGVGEGFDDEVGADVEGVGVVSGSGVIGVAEEDGAGAGGSAGGDVAGHVADGPGLGEVEGEVGGGLEEHAGFGFSPVVVGFVFGDDGFGVVGAVVGGIDVGAGLVAELFAHFLIDGFDGGFVEHAAGDAGLVGDDDEAVAEAAEGGEGGGGAGEEFDLGGIAEVTIVVDEGVVAVEKDGAFGHGEEFL